MKTKTASSLHVGTWELPSSRPHPRGHRCTVWELCPSVEKKRCPYLWGCVCLQPFTMIMLVHRHAWPGKSTVWYWSFAASAVKCLIFCTNCLAFQDFWPFLKRVETTLTQKLTGCLQSLTSSSGLALRQLMFTGTWSPIASSSSETVMERPTCSTESGVTRSGWGLYRC